MSSIHKTKFGTYRVRWREDGKLRSKTCKSRIEAERWQEKFEPVIAPQTEPQPEARPETKTMIFKELAERWLSNYAEVRKAPSSVILDRQLLRDYWLPALGYLSIDEIKPTGDMTISGVGQVRQPSSGHLQTQLHSVRQAVA